MSSTLIVDLPTGSSVVEATLFWSAYTSAAYYADSNVTIYRNGVFNQTVVAYSVMESQLYYQSVGDMTDIIKTYFLFKSTFLLLLVTETVLIPSLE